MPSPTPHKKLLEADHCSWDKPQYHYCAYSILLDLTAARLLSRLLPHVCATPHPPTPQMHTHLPYMQIDTHTPYTHLHTHKRIHPYTHAYTPLSTLTIFCCCKGTKAPSCPTATGGTVASARNALSHLPLVQPTPAHSLNPSLNIS